MINPHDYNFPMSLSQLLKQAESAAAIRDWHEVDRLSKEALALEPKSVHALLLSGLSLIFLARLPEARNALETAVKLDPKSVPYEGLATAYQTEGLFEEAAKVLEQGIEANPKSANLYAQLAETKKIGGQDVGLIERMERLAQDTSLNEGQLSDLYFGLGKAYNDLGDYEKAMARYNKAHEFLRAIRPPFDRGRYAAEREGILSLFSKDFIERKRSLGDPSDVPIFVAGMMRSGTTLMEQILSSHPAVGPAGEQPFWLDNGIHAIDYSRKELIPQKLRELTGAYLKLLRRYVPDKPHVTDKHPGNIGLAGLICVALPHSRMVCMRRHPVDVCLSIYMARRGFPWNQDKSDIVFVCRQYQRLMEHWRAALSADWYMEVRYEQLVGDEEAVLRQVLPFCGLEWDDRCLSHETNERMVFTPSLWQVRQPLYNTSVERWRRYEPWLGEFAELL